MGNWIDALFEPSPLVEVFNTSAEKLAKKLHHGADIARITDLTVYGPEATEALWDASQKLDAIADGIDKTRDGYLDFREVLRINNALKDLNYYTIRKNPEKAARSAGQLFASAGRLARHLPVPLSTYGRFLEGFGTFFDDLRKKMDPGPGGTTSQSKQFRELQEQGHWP